MEDVLAIALAPKLPTPNRLKTYSLAMWTLQAQNLPEPVLSVKKSDIVSAISYAIRVEFSDDNHAVVIDGFKVPQQSKLYDFYAHLD